MATTNSDIAPPLAGTSPGFRRVEIVCAIAFPVLAARLLANLWQAFSDVWSIAALALLTGFIAADFISGVVHWFFDTWFAPDTPFIGRAFVRTFREHHGDPTAICRHDFIETNGSNLLGACALVLCGLGVEPGSKLAAFFAGALLFTGVFVGVTSQIHKWSHSENVPSVVSFLQHRGWILSKEAHALHHRAPFSAAYCITSGWLNASLERVGFFRRLERAITVTTGARPRRDDDARADQRET